MTGKCVISKKMEPARFWLLWLINIHDHSKVTSLFPSSSNFSPSWFFIFKQSFIHLVLSGNRLVASLGKSMLSQFCCVIYSLSLGFWQFYFNRGLQRLYTGTCIILQKTINGFLCLLIVFLESKTYQLILKDVIKLNRNLR